MANAASVNGFVELDDGGFGLGVKFVDLGAVAVFDHAAAEFHGRGQRAIVGCELVGDQHDTLEFLEAGEVVIDGLDNPFVETLGLADSRRDQSVTETGSRWYAPILRASGSLGRR